MSIKYSSLLINTLLNASKQTDDDMYRASALSNLGQLCTVLKYSLSKDLSEVNIFKIISSNFYFLSQLDLNRLKKLFINI